MKYESTSDEAYLDRNLCAQVIVRMAQKLGYATGIKENGDWPILYVDLPSGQVSWHIPKCELLSDLPKYSKEWDGHDVAEKRKRIMEFVKNENFESKGFD
ncbi:hypothetical protein ACNF40_08470 [Cuniculiplasma sp. SKW4]|uniref:hypothetical protein n=1 Tax=Cuniculiplasma sp. SKW4 TaxID=3400171 RepID=UPI003FD45502